MMETKLSIALCALLVLNLASAVHGRHLFIPIALVGFGVGFLLSL